MADPILTDEQIAAMLTAPKRSRSGDKEIEMQGVGDAIKAIQYAENRTRRRKLFSTRLLSPPGTQ